MRRLSILLLLVILVGAFSVRLYRFDSPIADWHSWRQADTSSVSRNFVQKGFDVLHPRFDDLSNIPSGRDNPNGYRFVEFPIYNIFQAGLFILFGIFTLEQWGRLVTIFASLASCIFIYLLVKRHANEKAALLASFFYAFLPFNIYYGRVILPDTTAVMAILGGIYFFDLWIAEVTSIKHQASKIRAKIKNYFYMLLALLFTSGAFLLKPYGLFFTLPMIYLAFARLGWGFLKKWQLWLFLILSIAPLAWWRQWMLAYPEGIPASSWLFNEGNIRFKGAFFHWIFAERIGKLLLGYWGVILLGIGIIAKIPHLEKRSNYFFYSFLLSSLLYVTVIARGNVQHDYYQIFIIPTLAIFMGLGGSFLLNLPKEYFHQRIGFVLFSVVTLFSFIFSWYHVRDYFNINNRSIVVAGEAVDKLIPKDAKIIANYTGDTSLLYQTKRQGWPSFQADLPKMVEMGADYLLLVNPKEPDYEIKKYYKIVSETQDYLLFDLHERGK